MKELTKDSLSDIKENAVSVLLVYMPGCGACETIKPVFSQLEQAYPTIAFMQGNLAEIAEFYLQYADEDLETIEEATGKPMKKVVAPMFYVFVSKEQEKDNEFGWVGGIPGADLNSLQHVLEVLQPNE